MKINATKEQVNKAIGKMRGFGTVTVTGSQGTFDVKGVKGRYSHDNEQEILKITINDKPFLASGSMIESEINKFFN